jgi:hypothetical protein
MGFSGLGHGLGWAQTGIKSGLMTWLMTRTRLL